MRVSVVIPTFNRAHTLARALDSVLTQRHPAQEIIVVDDGSTDNTADVLEKYSDRIAIIQQDNKGVSSARNRGVEQACSPWIAFLDSDDVWTEDKLLFQSESLRHSEYCIGHTDELWIRNGIRVNAMQKHAKPSGWIYPHCLPLCCVSPSSVVIHQSVFDQVGLFDESLPACEDYDLWLRIFNRFPVWLNAEYLVKKFGGHSDQLSRRYPAMDRFRVQALENMLSDDSLRGMNRKLTKDTLRQKLTILLNGAKKRQQTQDIKQYQDQLDVLG